MSASPTEQPVAPPPVSVSDALYKIIALEAGALSNITVAWTQINNIMEVIFNRVNEQQQQSPIPATTGAEPTTAPEQQTPNIQSQS